MPPNANDKYRSDDCSLSAALEASTFHPRGVSLRRQQ